MINSCALCNPFTQVPLRIHTCTIRAPRRIHVFTCFKWCSCYCTCVIDMCDMLLICATCYWYVRHVKAHIWMRHVIDMCNMTHPYVCPSFMTHPYVCPCFIYMCAMTHSSVCHDTCIHVSNQESWCHIFASFACATWLTHTKLPLDVTHTKLPLDVTHTKLPLDNPCVPWLLHACVVTHSCVHHDDWHMRQNSLIPNCRLTNHKCPKQEVARHCSSSSSVELQSSWRAVCVYVCVCVCACVCVYVCVCVFAYMCMRESEMEKERERAWEKVCVCVCVCAHTHTQTNTNTHKHTHARQNTHIITHKHARANTHKHTHTCKRKIPTQAQTQT